MVRINNMLSMLRWFFTPIKLYGGDDSDNSGGASGTAGTSAGDAAASAMGDQSGYHTEDTSLNFLGAAAMFGGSGTTISPISSVTEADFNSPIGMDFSNTYGGSYMNSVSSSVGYNQDPFTAHAQMDSMLNNYASVSMVGNPLGNKGYSISGTNTSSFGSNSGFVGETIDGSSFQGSYSNTMGLETASYEGLSYNNDGSYTSYSSSYSPLSESFTTTNVSRLDDGGYSVDQLSEGTFTDSTMSMTTTIDGLIGKSYESTSFLGLTLNTDTHYTSYNEKVGWKAEVGLDIAESITGRDVEQSTTDSAYAIEGIVDVVTGLQGLPAMASLAMTSGIPAGYRATAAISTAMKTRGALTSISGLATQYGLTGTKGTTNENNNNQLTGGSGMTSYTESNYKNNSIEQVQGGSTKSVASSKSAIGASTLSASPQYASLVETVGHTGREDYSWNSMQSFRINYTGDKT